jgi:cytochrome P450
VIRDLTDSLISAFKKEIIKENSKDVGSLEDIPALMTDMFVAGAGTTSSVLAWFILYMVLHKNVQEKIQVELDIVVGKDRMPVLDDAKNMPYLQAVLCEVLRIANVLSFVGTNAICDTTISGYHIPKGTLVCPNLKRVHHDEREWPEPDVFKPERFLDSEEKFVGWTKLHGFMPFGAGRRECTGQSLARIMMITFASTLLHHYEIVLPDGAEKPNTEILAHAHATVLRPPDFEVVAKKRF